MGQRPSMQQSEVARRPRAGSELGSSAQPTGSSSATAHIHNHRRANGTRSRQPQNDTSSPSSASSASPASAHSSRSFTEEAAEGVTGGGAAELARFFNQLGFVPVQSSSNRHRTSAEILIGGTSTSPSGSGGLAQPQQQNGDAASSAPSTSVRHASSSSSNLQHRRSAGGGDSHNTNHHHHRHRRLGGTASGANAATSAAHQRVSRNHQRGGDNTSDRLQALLHSLEAMANASGDAGALSSSSASVQLTAVQLNKLRRTAPLLQLLGRDFKCPVCQKVVPSDDVEMHLVMCLTRPQLSYNDDVLTMDKGECAICLEEMEQGAHIARLPCLCIYHKGCIDEWFKRKNTCPEHPGNED